MTQTVQPVRPEPSADRRSARSVGKVLLGLAVVLVLVTLAASVGAFAFSFNVSGPSMLPTLDTGERIMTNPFGSTVNRFDVVALNEPGKGSGARIVKRVIGLPGDRIELQPTPAGDALVLVRPAGQGQWYQVVQPTWTGDWANSVRSCCGPDGKGSQVPTPMLVPPGQYFVVGDNVSVSIDSRTFGWVDRGQLIGSIVARVWPLDQLGSLPNTPTLRPYRKDGP